MPGRYEMVDEPEAMEVVDDDVYHPDLSVRDSGANSLRSLEPIIAGPIGLKTIFYDPRWSTRQRKCCVGIVLSVSLCCLAILISLMVGLGKVISYINQNEQMKKSGLFMIPNLADADSGIFLYNLPKNDDKYKQFAELYWKEIDTYLDDNYRNKTFGSKYTDCKGKAPGKGQLCRFDIESLGNNCTKANKYGYYDGNPCILFAVRNVRTWVPKIDEAFLKSPEVNKSVAANRKLDKDHMPLACSATIVPMFNAPGTNLKEHLEFYPEEGFDMKFLQRTPDLEEEPQLAPLVFLQLKAPYQFSELHVKCKILASNIKDISGLRTIEFEVNNVNTDIGMESIEAN